MSDPTARTLRLLALLQERGAWAGPELAVALHVTPRTVRRDVERLRELGYAIDADPGVGGGYRIARGTALPPLVLGDDEAVSLAVALRLAAGSAVDGIAEPAARALALVEQVTPARLRPQVAAVTAALAPAAARASSVPLPLVTELARAIRDEVLVTMTYTSRAGEQTDRRVEPYRLVPRWGRWYLLAHDIGRDDWRTLRLDRMTDVHRTTFRFRPRPVDDAAELVERLVGSAAYRFEVRVRYEAPCEVVAEAFGDGGHGLEPDGAGCVLTTRADDLDRAAWHLVRPGLPFTVIGPPELRAALGRLAALAAAAAG